MAVYFYWGDDDFRLQQAVQHLRQQVDPAWASFNDHRYPPDSTNAPIEALNQAVTPPFGTGQRLVWLADTPLGQRCPEAVLSELSRTLPQLPDTTTLLFTSRSKPDGRGKFLKLLKKHGEVKEFSALAPWKTDQIQRQVEEMAAARSLPLAPDTVALLTEAVGGHTRQLHQELDKLALYWGERSDPLPLAVAESLVTTSTQTSLKLAQALKQGRISQGLALVDDLLNQNEPALRIVATLVNQFRTWLWVKLMTEAGERDNAAIAAAADIGNPKRVYFLQKEVRSLPLAQLQKVLPMLLELESDLKLGRNARAALHTKVVEIGGLFAPSPSRAGTSARR